MTGALHCDSRKVRAGDGFIAWPGAATDGRKHVASAPADVVLLAGKGHEDYQEIAGVKHPFDDRVHARHALEQRA